MCGIAAIINLSNTNRIPESLIASMTHRMEHRGPDDFGIYIDEQVALGHRRLSIIDLSKDGKQPFFDESGQYSITFNGEVYNYQELKQALLQKGYSFRSKTDTEVILNAYRDRGIDCLQDFNGMFAMALYDKPAQRMFVARDRIGIKPLYYCHFDGRLLFASEIKALLQYPGFHPQYDLEGISSYLSFRYPIANLSLYQSIHPLPPGHFLKVDLQKGTFQQHQYYELPIQPESIDLGESFYQKQVHELLRSSIQYRMISDRKVGAYLSGGLDSSIVVSQMAQLNNNAVKTFTIGFQEKGYNEFEYARMVAERYQTEHHELLMSADDYLAKMKTLIGYKDAPLGVANEPALYEMSKALKEHFTVVLSGEGADEIFGGYGRIFRSPLDFQRMKALQNGHALHDDPLVQQLQHNLSQKYGQHKFQDPLSFFLHLYQYTGWADKEQLLSDDFRAHLHHDQRIKATFQPYFDQLRGLSPYQQFMWIFEKVHIVGLLQRVDVTTMATSVEARVPFVDHRLIEFAMSIPVKYKLRWKSAVHEAIGQLHNTDQISEIYDDPKYILKKAFEKDLPHEVVWRKKVGFPVPVHSWFGNEFNALAHALLLDQTAKERGLYNTAFIEKALKDQQAFTNHRFGLKIWMLVNLELWLREYFN